MSETWDRYLKRCDLVANKSFEEAGLEVGDVVRVEEYQMGDESPYSAKPWLAQLVSKIGNGSWQGSLVGEIVSLNPQVIKNHGDPMFVERRSKLTLVEPAKPAGPKASG